MLLQCFMYGAKAAPAVKPGLMSTWVFQYLQEAAEAAAAAMASALPPLEAEAALVRSAIGRLLAHRLDLHCYIACYQVDMACYIVMAR
jgi:hypothetical protein